MRTCIVGGGLAGALLAWRLAGTSGAHRVDLVAADHPDATSASGGVVRAFEPDPWQRTLAVESLAELTTSRVLRRWARYRPTGSVYVRSTVDGLVDACTGIEGASVVDGRALPGWAGLPEGSAAVVERTAGYVVPDALRRAVIADAAVTVHSGPAGPLDAIRREYDVVVLATGAWTRDLLVSAGYPAAGYRTKSIQYTVYATGGLRPPAFVDETTGLYGRPTADGLLLGLPTDAWDVPPGRSVVDEALHERAAALAGTRFPGLRLGPPTTRVGSTDCYCEPAVLALRAVHPGLYTFTGGSGGSVKTALAASRRAANQLVASGQPIDPIGRRTDQP